MLAFSLGIVSIFIRIILLSIHDRDEIHKLVAFLLELIAILCIFVLIPPFIKVVLGLLLLSFVHSFFSSLTIFD